VGQVQPWGLQCWLLVAASAAIGWGLLPGLPRGCCGAAGCCRWCSTSSSWVVQSGCTSIRPAGVCGSSARAELGSVFSAELLHSPPLPSDSPQEYVARVHALGVVRKRVMPFQLGPARGAGCLSTGEAIQKGPAAGKAARSSWEPRGSVTKHWVPCRVATTQQGGSRVKPCLQPRSCVVTP